MKKFHPFFNIGTVGVITIAVLHIILALGFSLSSVHTAFFVIYPTFASFLILGFTLTLRRQKECIVAQ